MCGLGAIVQLAGDRVALERSLGALERAQAHRGPDGRHFRVAELAPPAAGAIAPLLGLALQRLAVVDLSSRSDQPMQSPCGRYVICFNGEIYNYKELAAELRRAGDTSLPAEPGDTMVLLACLARWGTGCLPMLNGMWAFVLFDREANTLLVARDRMGVKPLFWALDDRGLVLASEVKGVLAATGKRYAINEDVAARHLAQSLANTDTQTMFRGIEAAPAGSFARIELAGPDPLSLQPRFERFWRHPFELGKPLLEQADPHELCELLQDAVRLRLRSDVPCGLLLSGGLDSSSILAAAHSQQLDLQVLSVVSRDPASSEEYWVKQMARHCGVQPTWIRIDEDPLSILSDLDDASRFNDAPLPGLAMIAQQRLMRAAQDKGITVLLSGQGADEQLGGYNKFLYFYLMQLLQEGRYGEAASQAWACFARGTVLNEFRLAEAKRYLPWRRASASIVGPRLAQAQLCDTASAGSYAAREWRDLHSLSLPLLLHCEDSMSMSCSRETRHPFMDYRIVELLATVPARQKFQDGWPKWILRQAMRKHLPVSVTWRRDKKGFNIPEASWLRTAFVPHVQQWLAGEPLCVAHGLVNAPALALSYRRFIEGAPGAAYKDVLAALTLESWLRVNDGTLLKG
ncbi:asparagine synthase (glutamine-hydrolyzing) [Caenimonas sedimenti]|uniref:asparagine synthase (glutamine-hydrolyzing) n=1 Tax=Caenimonas sedimenti TaxID=2596921 RepID=A0A562ZF35_9BURK|nr:asparagine synthase (glutamine-hydrolyzing) [Caenimonas sedimenti]TWO66144.1 asparagine synthase (glutamine-hydrolyzing) [Caenimonas sedimenti]